MAGNMWRRGEGEVLEGHDLDNVALCFINLLRVPFRCDVRGPDFPSPDQVTTYPATYHSPRKAASPNATSQDGDVNMPIGTADPDPDPEPPEDESEKIVPWQECLE